MLPSTIDFRITSKCNMQCPFCFGTKVSHNINLSSLLAFLEKVRKKGVDSIVLTGGEPTLSSDFGTVLNSLYDMGYTLALSTNGSFWNSPSIREDVLRYVSCISLPLESVDSAVHNSLRPGIPKHYEMVQKILQDLSTTKLNIRLKISTVVTKTNIGTLSGLLNKLPLEPEIWKLYQLSVCNSNEKFYNTQHISDKQFRECLYQLQQTHATSATRIVGGYEFDRDRKYLFLEPNGELKTIVHNQEVLIGHISDNDEYLSRRISIMVDTKKVQTNFRTSFT